MSRTLACWQPTDRVGISLQWMPGDLRIGPCWRTWPMDGAEATVLTDIWIHLLPCLPINITWERPAPGANS
jgi:hypothetical protein